MWALYVQQLNLNWTVALYTGAVLAEWLASLNSMQEVSRSIPDDNKHKVLSSEGVGQFRGWCHINL